MKKNIKTKSGDITIFSLKSLEKQGFPNISSLPYSIKVLLECVLRNNDGYQVTDKDIKKLAGWDKHTAGKTEIAFKPGRVILQDFTGVPCVVDLASMRQALKHMGGDPQKINPQVPCDLVIDHSVQIDSYGKKSSLKENIQKEFERNKERYEFLKWGQKNLENFRIIPPARGIIHQVNLECLAKGVLTKQQGTELIAYPDSVVGTDSHTTMINALGIVGWGVGGIEAEAVMLGEPIYMLMPEVIGFCLKGELPSDVTATDLVLTIVELLRKKGVVGKFVEFFGPGLQTMTLPDRATLANMAPEYGATMGFFPVDKETLKYLKDTGRTPEQVDLVERYSKEQGMFYSSDMSIPEYSDTVELDLSTIVPCLAGPKRPQDRIELSNMKTMFRKSVKASKDTIKLEDGSEITHGVVGIASITSCTNTSNPFVLIAAGLLAKNAVEKGLKSKSFVKTSLAPGSTVVTEYLKQAGLMPYLEELGFHVVAYGCATCIGNSGPLNKQLEQAIKKYDLVAASVVSGNRNFEGRINPLIKANYLASPVLVVAYALAGTVDIDLYKTPLGTDQNGKEIYLKDILPCKKEIDALMKKVLCVDNFVKAREKTFKGDQNWDAIKAEKSELYAWNKNSTYIQNPPFFDNLRSEAEPIAPIKNARVLLLLGDSVTTDHISPAGAIKQDSPAGLYLQNKGIKPDDFNSYGSRRGNDHVMARGTFANIRLRNQLAPGTEGEWTKYFPKDKVTTIYEAAQLYGKDKTPLVVLAGKEYGTGSSRDWAAKGPALLGVRVVIAESYERIHRSNLVGMGILPLQFKKGQNVESLGLKGDEIYDVIGLDDDLKPGQDLVVVAKGKEKKEFKTIVRIDTPVEIEYYRNGGILKAVLRKKSEL